MKETGRDFLIKLVKRARKVYTHVLDLGNHFKICYYKEKKPNTQLIPNTVFVNAAQVRQQMYRPT